MARWSDEEITAMFRRQQARPVPTVAGMRPRDRWPHLEHLLGAYLHQDFDIDGSAEDCVRLGLGDFKEDDRRAALANELRELTAQGWDEDDVARALDDLGMEYLPYADGRTNVEWVDWIARRVAGEP